MKKYFILLLILAMHLLASAYFQTQYVKIDSLSEEWQQAGINGIYQKLFLIGL